MLLDAMNGVLDVHDLAEITGIPVAAVLELLEPLVRRGFVQIV